MSNVILGVKNQIDVATLSGGSWLATLPLANLQNATKWLIARSTNATLANTKIRITLPNNPMIRVVALVNHNLSAAARVRIRVFLDASFATQIYASGWGDVWPSVYTGDGNVGWDDPTLGPFAPRPYTDEEKSGYMWNYVRILSPSVFGTYWLIEIDDTSNPAGYVDIGRVFIGPGWSPTYNMAFGNTLGWESDTDVQKSIYGNEFFYAKRPCRVAQFSLPELSLDESMASVYEIIKKSGIDKEVMFIYDPADTYHFIRRSFMGRLRQLSHIEYVNSGQFKAAFEIKETL